MVTGVPLFHPHDPDHVFLTCPSRVNRASDFPAPLVLQGSPGARDTQDPRVIPVSLETQVLRDDLV